MSAASPGVRVLLQLFAVLQLVLPGAASIADARLDAASVRARPSAHIEEHGSPSCGRYHPADCAFCRVLSVTASTVRRDSGVQAACAATTPSVRVAIRLGRASESATQSRAPPAPG